MKPSLLLAASLLNLSISLATGDVIQGIVTDAADNSPIAGARVSLDAQHFVFTGPDGRYDFNTTGLFHQGAPAPRLRWDAPAGLIRWDEAYGEVTVDVRDVAGHRIGRAAGPSAGTAGYSLAGLPDGIHIVTLRTRLGVFRFRACLVEGRPALVREETAPAPGGAPATRESPAAARVAAANALTFEKNNYESQTKTVEGDRSDVNVALAGLPVLTLDNGLVHVTYARAGGALAARNLAAGVDFVKSLQLSGTGGAAKYLDGVTENNFQDGQAVEIAYPNGDKDRILLFPKSAFVYFKHWVGNKTAAVRTVDKVAQVKAVLSLKTPVAGLKAAGTQISLTDVNQNSFGFLAFADPATRNGVVGAWVTSDFGIGSVAGSATGGALAGDPAMTANAEYGVMRVQPGQTRAGDLFALGWFDDARLGLEANADDIARAYAIKMKPNQVVWCTWQSVGGDGSPAIMAATADWLKTNLVPYGFSVAQIDDGWQAKRRQFDGYGAGWPQGMKPTADRIKADGMTAGLWFMPFAGTNEDAHFSPWYLHDNAGAIESHPWAGTSLDVSLPAVKDYIKNVTRYIYTDWGYRYFKIDGMYTGLGAHITYTNDVYDEADKFFFNAKYSDPNVTNVEAYRGAWKVVRDNAPDAFIMGCTVAQNMRTLVGGYGIVDAMRIGPDGKDGWKDIVGKGIIRGARRYFYNGRVFWIDPDPVYAHDTYGKLTCSFNALTGFMFTPAEDYANQGGGKNFPPPTAAQVDVLKRTIAWHGSLDARPADFFEHDNPNFWTVSDEKSGVRRDVVGVFNWNETGAQSLSYSMARLGLSGAQQYVGFDYWGNAFVNPFSGTLTAVLPPAGVKVISLRAVSGNPMVVSTSRHVSQGIFDIAKEGWNGSVLSGTSKLVAGDDYELRIYAAKASGNWTAGTPAVDGGATASVAQTGAQVRVTIKSAAGGVVNWSLPFN
jgi:hypothetical protein